MAGDRPTVDEVLAAVGDDPGQAQAALDDELAQEEPRSTLVSKLEKLAAPPADGAELFVLAPAAYFDREDGDPMQRGFGDPVPETALPGTIARLHQAGAIGTAEQLEAARAELPEG